MFLEVLQMTVPETDWEVVSRDNKHLKYMRLTLETMLDKALDDEPQRRIKVAAMRIL